MEDALELARQVAWLGPTEQALRAYEAVRCGPPGDRCMSCIKQTKVRIQLSMVLRAP